MKNNKGQKGSVVAQNKDHTLYKLRNGKVVTKQHLINKMKKGRKYYDLKGAEISFVEQQDGSIFLRTIADQSSSNNLSDVPIAELSGTKTISEHSQQVNGRRRVRFNKYYSQILIPSICLILIALSVFLVLFFGYKKSNSPPPSPIPKIVPEELLTFSGDNTTVTGHEDISAYNTLIIPEKHNEVDITSIGIEAFSYCSSLTSIILPNSLTSIGNRAFHACDSLASVALTRVIDWTGSTFQLVDGTNGSSNGGLITDGSPHHNAFLIKSVNIANGWIHATCGTDGGIAVGNITIPSSINNYTVTSILERAFSYCTSLISLTLPNTLIFIDIYAFSDCSNIISLTLPNSLTSIGRSAFDNCSSLTSLALTEVIGWSGSIFQLIDGTNGINNGNPIIDGFLHNNAFLIKSSDISSGGINATCTYSAVNYDLGGIAVGDIILSNIGSSPITSIGLGAFQGCASLTSITLPNSLASIGSYAFQGCSFLDSITANFDSPPTFTAESWAFDGVASSGTVKNTGILDSQVLLDYLIITISTVFNTWTAV